jgi:cobalt-zinc-cadmium resistance protein CzcA
VLVIFGWRAVSNLPVEAFPDVQDVQVQIITQAPGQAPEEVERSVTLPVERGMSGVPGLMQMRSVSMTGLSVVTLTFSEHTDDYFARQQVMEHLQDDVTLPPGVQPGLAPLSTAVGEIYRYIIDAPASYSASDIRALQDWQIAPIIRRVPGVADVNSFGGLIRQYQVRVNPFLLHKFNISLDQLSQALTAASSNVGGGVLHHGDEVLVIRGIGLFKTVDDISRVVVTSHNGTPVLVGDVAQVVIGDREPSGIVSYGDRDSVNEGIVVMTKGQNPAVVIAALRQQMDQLQQQLPPGVKLHTVYDRTTLIKHTVETVTENLVVGAMLVLSILLIFLRDWRAAVSVAVVIPLAMLFAFVLMDVKGQSANLISLGAVDFGIIIDSAVVMVEALMVRLALRQLHTHDPLRRYGVRLNVLKHTVIDMGRPILFSKAIIILAFLPIFTFQRVEGKIFSPMAFTLTFALLGAILLTLTLTPVLLSFSLRKRDMAETHLGWMHWLQESYRHLLTRAEHYHSFIIGGAVLVAAITFACVPFLGSEFLPKLDEGNIWLTITLPPSTAIEKTKDLERAVRGIILSYPEVESVIAQVGRPDDGTDPKGPNNMEIMVDLKPRSTWRFADKDALINSMSERIHHIPGVPTNFSQVIEDNVEEALSGVKGEIAIKIFGPDLDVLTQKSDQVADIISHIRGAADVAAIQIGGQTELDIRLDAARMARYGLRAGDVNNTLATALGGNAVNSFYEGDRIFDVTVRLDKSYRDATDTIGSLPIVVPEGGTIPLSAIADIDVKQGAARISREQGERDVSIKANLVGRDQGGFVKEAMATVAREVQLPPGYHMTWGGQFENQQRAMARLAVIVPLSLLMVALVLFMAFRSLRKAGLILMLLPFMIIGGFMGLGLAGLHMSISAAVGFIALSGISVQNGVIMVEEIVGFIRKGVSVSEAVVDGAVLRLRPILMTGLMAGLGLLPAALSHGIGSETQRPFAVVIVGGIVTSTLFTLLLLPLLYPVLCKNDPSH